MSENLHYCLKNLKNVMQFIFKFACFSILFFKTSFAFLINLNRHFLKINICFIHHISHHSRFVNDVALQYYCIYSKLKNKIKLINSTQNLKRKNYVFFLNFLQSHAKNIFWDNSINVSLRRIDLMFNYKITLYWYCYYWIKTVICMNWKTKQKL